MKFLIPSILVIIILGTACDNFEVSSIQEETFIRNYGVGMEDEGLKVITTNEGYLILANVENPGRGRDICIITTDKYGNTTAPVTTYGGNFDDIGYTIKPREGGYIIAGSTQASPTADKDVYYILLDANGLVEKEDPIPLPNNNEAYDVLVEDDGDLIFTGYTESGGSNQQRNILFLKYRPSGDITQVFNHIGVPEDDEEAFSVVLWRDTTYMFAGYQKKANATRNIYLLRWSGYTRLAESYDKQTEGNSEARCIINTADQNVFLVACNNELSLDQSEILLLETDYTLDDDSTTLIEKMEDRPMNKVQSMALRGNSLFLCGTASSGGLDNGDMMLIQLTLEGTNPKFYYIGDGASYTGNGFDLTNDNGYVITGASYLNEKSMITLFKVNNEGKL